MAEDDTLTNALTDVRARRAALQGDYDRIVAELTKLRAAEAALTAIVEGTPLENTQILPASDVSRSADGDRSAIRTRWAARQPRSASELGEGPPEGSTQWCGPAGAVIC